MDSKWTLKHNKHHCIIVNQGGKNIGYQPNAGVQIMEEDGYGFKDLNGSGHLDAFEDWRLPLKKLHLPKKLLRLLKRQLRQKRLLPKNNFRSVAFN